MSNSRTLATSFALAGLLLVVPLSVTATPQHSRTFQVAENDDGPGLPADEWKAKEAQPIRAAALELYKKKYGKAPVKFGFTSDDIQEAWHNHKSVRYRTVGVWSAWVVERDGENKGLIRYHNLMADRRGDGKWGKWYLDEDYATPGDNYFLDPDKVK